MCDFSFAFQFVIAKKMADLRFMSRELLAEFIDLYRNNERLWEIESKAYSDKQKKCNLRNIGQKT